MTDLTKKDVKAATAAGDLATLSVALGGSTRIRHAAIRALESIGTPEAVEVLAEQARGDVLPVQEDTAMALKRLGDPRGGLANRRTLWLQGLIDEEPVMPAPASPMHEVPPIPSEPIAPAEAPRPERRTDRVSPTRVAVAPLGTDDIESLAATVADEQRDRGDRCEAIAELVRSRVTSAAPVLMAVVGSTSTLVAARAAAALGKLGDPGAVGTLVGALQSNGRPQVRRAAAQALGQLADPASTETLTRAGTDAETSVRSEAASALDNVQTVNRLDGLLRSPKTVSDQVDAVRALVRLGPDLATPRLIDAASWLTPTSPAAQEIAYALDDIDRPDATAALESLIASGVVLSVAHTPTIIGDPMLRWAFAQHLRRDEHPVFVAHDVPGRPESPGPGTSLMALEDRLLLHRTGTTSSMTIDGVERALPDISEVPYRRLTNVAVHFPARAKEISSGETLTAGVLGGAILGGLALTILDGMRKADQHSWVIIRGDDLDVELGGEVFLKRGQTFVRWLQQRLDSI